MRYLIPILLLLFTSRGFTQSTPVNTETREITYQEKRTYQINDVYFSNEFPGARLNKIEAINDTLVQITIEPENSPINASPWYAFKMWSADEVNFTIHLKYVDGPQRYFPKISFDAQSWAALDSASLTYDPDEVPRRFLAQTQDSLTVYSQSFMKVKSSPDTTWIAAQELLTSSSNSEWVASISKRSSVSSEEIGKSALGAPILKMDIGNVKSDKVLIVFSRQHPPEVTGYLAMRAFVETLLEKSKSASKFRKEYHTIVIPMVNPDGVDLGHWRHNTGGVDLNRDWSNLHQPETTLISKYLKEYLDENGKKASFGIDFHSTWKDIFYVLNRSAEVTQITKPWLDGMEQLLPGFTAFDREVPLEGAGTSVRFFYQQLGSDGVTYEVGDDTDRAYLKEKAEAAAHSLMNVLNDLD